MKLYHGTTGEIARKALTEGLKPRSVTGLDSTWEKAESNPDMIYLSETYAPYFAFNASGMKKEWGLLEIDTNLLNESSFFPDEDFLEQATRIEKPKDSWVGLLPYNHNAKDDSNMHQRTQWFRDNISRFQVDWQSSVENLGNACYEGEIPADAIIRAVTYEPSSNQYMTIQSVEPLIVIMNHKFCGDRYRELTKWYMGDKIIPANLFMAPDHYEAIVPKAQRDKVDEIISDQSGIIRLK